MVNTLKQLIDSKIVAVIRADSNKEALDYSNACIRGGIKSIELTYTIPKAGATIEKLSNQFPDLLIGAGTVLDVTTARSAILAGAKFIVSPGFDKDTSELCNLYQVPYLPGCMTVTEMMTALSSGCSMVKLFPGSMFGPTAIQQFLAPLPQLSIMPTGGVNLYNLNEWFNNGAEVVGIGSSLLKGSLKEVESRSKEFVSKASEFES
ncbi:bifunctional 2-keto-4-hydroxyglutarate aldolase/2-keto-3-deoxy-6-phosphogluconate aldolase [Virgibacillus ihumii]|uniref:bifunctional 2-keto-4-hydroxyglutarate aldolase/2-keto-3-deoxy-6-phosphogluconate aldolase n=1 Tax=Virgibacillus ihumii TaxID=2686091 RepID=UPI00157D332F|nr:bifunctional 2-keto-4-hydroxyglutarate aldolase/2-keto-3-deoxy-6-phosphogluconate aldolase [Virgibacillus ihumii]